MTTIVTFRQHVGVEQTWVPRVDEEWWLGFWAKRGVPAARLRDYKTWGGFFPPSHGFGASVMMRPEPRRRRTYRRWVRETS